MSASQEEFNRQFFRHFWKGAVDTYEAHPTSRHRRRFVLRSLKQQVLTKSTFVFDYGCGPGAVLRYVKAAFRLSDDQLGGCDISPEALEISRGHIPSTHFYLGSFPRIERPIDIAICSEVIEHTGDFAPILRWLHENLTPNGLLILTTPGPPMDPPDVSYGHVQHFVLEDLLSTLVDIGFRVDYGRRWGFPFFTLQKALTTLFYERIRKAIIDTGMSTTKKVLFEVVYYSYFIHYAIPYGPQLFIRARNVQRQ